MGTWLWAIDYTVTDLQPSGHNDGVWYSDVTAKGVSGSPTPNIADFNARAVNSSTYAVMKGNETDGLPNQPLAPGTQTTGRLYFDVKGGTVPDSVVYRNAGGTDKVVWKELTVLSHPSRSSSMVWRRRRFHLVSGLPVAGRAEVYGAGLIGLGAELDSRIAIVLAVDRVPVKAVG